MAALLGQGAFGSVYLADTVGGGLDRRVAIKLLRPEKVSTPGLLGRLRDEARMLAAIRHRAIVRVDDLMELDGSWAIVMEYVEGCDLTELLRHGAIPPVAALAIIEEVAGALHAAYHQSGPDGTPLRLIHRDIKPSNLRVTAQGEVKILDFGVARAELKGREEVTTEAAFGTVPYMAPERFYGEDSHAGDIYALGVTLFEMLTGVKPGKSAMDADRTPPGDKLRAQWAWLEEISQPLFDLVGQMLSAKAADRPTARETVRVAATIRASLPGDTLDEWAERVVPPSLRLQEDRRGQVITDRTGTLLLERSGVISTASKKAPKAKSNTLLWVAPVGMVVAGGMALALVIAAFLVPMDGSSGAKAPEVAATVAPPGSASGGAGGAGAGAGTGAAAEAPGKPGGGAAGTPEVPAGSSGTPVPSGSGGSTKPGGASTAPGPRPAPVGASKPAATATTTATAAKPVVPAPTPEAPAAVPAPPSGPGHLSLAGDARSVSLSGGGGHFGAGDVPAGSYSAEVSFPDGTTVTTHVTMEAGKSVTLKCSSKFQNCKVIAE